MSLPPILEPYAKRKVRLIATNGEDLVLHALADMLNPKRDWGYREWLKFLTELKACELTVEDWTRSLEASRL